MKEISKEDLLKVNGGASLNATMINAIVRGMSTVLDLGRSFGSAIRRALNGSTCPI